MNQNIILSEQYARCHKQAQQVKRNTKLPFPRLMIELIGIENHINSDPNFSPYCGPRSQFRRGWLARAEAEFDGNVHKEAIKYLRGLED